MVFGLDIFARQFLSFFLFFLSVTQTDNKSVDVVAMLVFKEKHSSEVQDRTLYKLDSRDTEL